ncbi:hypothetical protein M444_33405 [Streptomyces sp. Mg1]|nr:hypothetical protein M444_33405 [Streptomyces sp. Mg1]RPK32329.1 hypothetical protein EES37_33555 [Streptomyces sp. ADI91-18]
MTDTLRIRIRMPGADVPPALGRERAAPRTMPADGAAPPAPTGKIERFHKTLRREFLNRVAPFSSHEAAQQTVDEWAAVLRRTVQPRPAEENLRWPSPAGGLGQRGYLHRWGCWMIFWSSCWNLGRLNGTSAKFFSSLVPLISRTGVPGTPDWSERTLADVREGEPPHLDPSRGRRAPRRRNG